MNVRVGILALEAEQNIRAEQESYLAIPEEYMQTSDLWGLKVTLRLLGVPLLWIVLLPYFYEWSPWLAYATTIPLGIAISKTTLLVHEAVHDTLFKTRTFNQIAGRLGGWWTLVDFASFDVLHRNHHITVGEKDDPQLLDYGELETANRITLIWHIIRPLFGWNIKHMLTLIKQRLQMRHSITTILGEFLGLITVQGLFLWLSTGGFKYPLLALIFPISAATVGLFMSQIRGFCEHVPMPGENPKMRLRSHISNPIERPFLHYMNYNYHGEHHKFPHIPSRNLPAFSDWLENQGEIIEHSPSYLATIWQRWKACTK